MEGFKTLPKMAHFKEGGSVGTVNVMKKGGKAKHGVPAVSKKDAGPKSAPAAGLKGTTPDVEDKTTLTMKKGGRSKKATGTVKKYKTGGGVQNVYEAKKSAGDKDNIRKTKEIKPAKAKAPSKAAVKPTFRASDVEKEKSKPAGDAVKTIKSKQSGKAAAAPSGAKGGPNKYKKGGAAKKPKKMADGSSTGSSDFTPEQEAWLGGADRTDPFILARMHDALGTTPASGSYIPNDDSAMDNRDMGETGGSIDDESSWGNVTPDQVAFNKSIPGSGSYVAPKSKSSGLPKFISDVLAKPSVKKYMNDFNNLALIGQKRGGKVR